MMPSGASRVVAQGMESGFTLPEPEQSRLMDSVGVLGSGGLSGGLGGSGSGGGRGDGEGTGTGSGTGPGLSAGLAGLTNPFGMTQPTANSLVGVFYDTKQDAQGKSLGVDATKTIEMIVDFTTKGWNEKLLQKYYRAPKTLHQTKLYIPMTPAHIAPAAFGCGPEVEPMCWVAIYRGTVTPPKTGRYRFVGCCDDVMVVRFNRKNVFDHGYILGTSGVWVPHALPVLRGELKDGHFDKLVRKGGVMKIPITFYQYDTTQNFNTALSGMAVGPAFDAKAGEPYPIEILLSEIPGGNFSASLMIEEVGVEYEKASTGAPILPIFRLDNTLPPPPNGADNAPPYDPKGPVWKVLPSTQPKI